MAWRRPMGRRAWAAVAMSAVTLAVCALLRGPGLDAQSRLPARSPLSAAYSPDGSRLAVTDHTAGEAVLLDARADRVVWRARVGQPGGICWSPDGHRLYVSSGSASRVVVLDAVSGAALRSFGAAARPVDLALSADGRRLAVACADAGEARVLDTTSGKLLRRVACPGQPSGIAFAPDGTLVVADLLPSGRATDPAASACVRIVPRAPAGRAVAVRLPSGATGVRGVAVSSDGRWAYAAHALCRFHMPTTQLDRGWLNTNAVSIIDLRARRHRATFLLDTLFDGAADPWGVCLSADGRTLWVALSGVHEVARVDVALLHAGLRGQPLGVPEPSAERSASVRDTWARIRQDPSRHSELANDLVALTTARLLRRMPLPGQGPRGIALAPNGKTLAVPLYFDGRVALTLAAPGGAQTVRSLGARPPADDARRGERLFHDATRTYQRWLSCATCHPDGRADGLNWDLMNDGIGNPKNTRSLLLAHRRSPVMSQGVRANAHVATVAGFRFIEFHEPSEDEVEAVKAYIASMRPRPSPRLGAAGRMTAKARRGRAVFLSRKADCSRCHRGAYLTDQRLYDVGTRGPQDTTARFLNPPLVELWRTAPYLHDGSARTMRDVLTTHNRGNRHGRTSHLSEQDIDALAEYLLSL